MRTSNLAKPASLAQRRQAHRGVRDDWNEDWGDGCPAPWSRPPDGPARAALFLPLGRPQLDSVKQDGRNPTVRARLVHVRQDAGRSAPGVLAGIRRAPKGEGRCGRPGAEARGDRAAVPLLPLLERSRKRSAQRRKARRRQRWKPKGARPGGARCAARQRGPAVGRGRPTCRRLVRLGPPLTGRARPCTSISAPSRGRCWAGPTGRGRRFCPA